ncbi:hypothetical protein CAI21_13200 [Alkalilimnicola ehrlichii]|uniref:Xcc1710-like domain-containing protein n=1 Tax=Alkalilimnicola ehrlichii TaxID=351052 RepID=A0A3E0WPF8_9GAMM|nr:Mth938-like domain-containing protein [Alkalilimnicola ehrlichii]RFA28269.1 hypothetical protein CAI21_13200 [Alkalilimnicola ehrlichii]RFA34870.1 hypothetical protein CAL65_14335 [Alkalilimnicola ehrlichii]
MKFSEEFGTASYRIRGYEPGRITVNQEVLETNVVVTLDTLVRDWPALSVEQLTPQDLAVLTEFEPEVILLGTGERQTFPDLGLLRDVIKQGIGVEVMDTAAACRTFNILMAEGRRVAAGLLVR